MHDLKDLCATHTSYADTNPYIENHIFENYKIENFENIIPFCLVFMYIIIIVIVMHYIQCLFHLITNYCTLFNCHKFFCNL